jgi:hypothetical protein
MKVIILVLIMAIILVGGGCSKIPAELSYATVSQDDTTWITAIASVEAYPGFMQNTNGMILHNGEGMRISTQKIMIGTEDKETEVEVNTKAPFADGEISSVNSLVSDNPNEQLTVKSYNQEKQTAVIGGLLPNTTRIITLVYRSWRKFKLEFYAINDPGKEGWQKSPEDASKWMTFPDSVLLAAKQQVSIPVMFTIPKDAKDLPKKWQFGIKATDTSQSGMLEFAYACTWRVVMRD